MSAEREQARQLQALITGAIQGALMKASGPGGPFAIDVEPVLDDEDNYLPVVRVRGRESGEQLLVRVEPWDRPATRWRWRVQDDDVDVDVVLVVDSTEPEVVAAIEQAAGGNGIALERVE